MTRRALAGNFPTVTRVLLGKIPPIDGKMSYVYDKHVFHYLVEGNVTYLCMADEGMKRRIPFTFLEDIKRRFVTQYGEAAHNAIAFAFNNEFSPVLQARAGRSLALARCSTVCDRRTPLCCAPLLNASRRRWSSITTIRTPTA